MRPSLLILTLILALSTSAQDPHFSQFYANSIYLNPALAGAQSCPHVAISYRNQWPEINKAFETYSASFDQYVDPLSGGIAVSALYDRTAGGLLNTGMISASYAYQLPITRDVTLNAGMRASFVQKSMNWHDAVWGDQIDPQRGFIYQTNQPTGENVNYADFAAGMFLSTKSWYAGFAVDHLTTPNESYYDNGSNLPMRYTIHAGGDIEMKHYGRKNGIVISPAVLYMKQGSFEQLNIGSYFKKDLLVVGAWYRWKDAAILMVGLELDQLRIGYSFDYTLSNLRPSTVGAHEVTASITMPCNNRNSKHKLLTCPAF